MATSQQPHPRIAETTPWGLILLVLGMVSLGAHAESAPCLKDLLHGTIWDEVARDHAVDPAWLYAIAMRETRRRDTDGLARPDPFVATIDGQVRRFADQESAARALRAAMDDDLPITDLGLMQIHVPSHRDLPPADELIDPFINLRTGAAILASGLAASNGRLDHAFERYHAGRVGTPHGQRYAEAVMRFVAMVECR